MLWDTLFALLLVGVLKYGDYITYECPQEGYTCPKICDVDHKHLPREGCNGKAKQESKPDSTIVQSIEQLYEKTVAANKSKRI